MTEIAPLSVSEITEHIRRIVESDGALRRVYVRGELSNYKIYLSGHHYFTLKDAGASIRCVMFRADAQRLRFRPENGMGVICSGRVAVYPRDGAYQLYVSSVMPEGMGDLHAAYEQLKAKLLAEGLFAQEHKKPLPAMPEKIALITSGAGAAVQDMIRILGKRWRLAKILVLPVRVQGTEAPAEIAGAIRYANRWHIADLIITGRGCGSMEDLWAFNDERVARAIYDSDIPVISAVGHEPDVTISDYVADLRAATPSNAAELAVPDQAELRKKLQMLQSSMLQSVQKNVKLGRQRLNGLAEKRVLQSPLNYLEDRRVLLDFLSTRLQAAQQKTLHEKKQQFIRLTAALDAMSPLKVLARGYSMVSGPDGTLLRRASDVQPGDTIRVSLSSSSLTASVEQIQEDAT